jgi:hypothetical protein
LKLGDCLKKLVGSGNPSDRELEEVKKLVNNGGRYRIRTYDFHRVRMALYR